MTRPLTPRQVAERWQCSEIERLRKQNRALKIALTTIKASAGSQTVYDIAAAALRDAK